MLRGPQTSAVELNYPINTVGKKRRDEMVSGRVTCSGGQGPPDGGRWIGGGLSSNKNTKLRREGDRGLSTFDSHLMVCYSRWAVG